MISIFVVGGLSGDELWGRVVAVPSLALMFATTAWHAHRRAAAQRAAETVAEGIAADLAELETMVTPAVADLEAAEALYVHRNTLLHRLERLETLLEIDLRDPWQRLNLFAAIKAYRLHSG